MEGPFLPGLGLGLGLSLGWESRADGPDSTWASGFRQTGAQVRDQRVRPPSCPAAKVQTLLGAQGSEGRSHGSEVDEVGEPSTVSAQGEDSG